MRRTALLVGLGACFLAAWPAAAHGQFLDRDSAVGQGEARGLIGPELEVTFDFTAASGPSGEAPTGYAVLDFVVFGSARFHVEGPVRCLRVFGNQALIGFELDPELSNFPAVGATIEVTDNGPPGSGTPDLFNSGPVSDPSSCVPRLLPPTQELIAGDIVVTDAPPLPTTKDQCRRGGHERFGFRNQGQCVAFVERGPKP